MNKFLIIIILFMTGCVTNMTKLSISYIDEDIFEITPHLILKNNEHFLKYQIKKQLDEFQTRRIIDFKIIDDGVYFYFVGKSSFKESFQEVEIPLKENLNSYAKKGYVFWLNPDGSSEKLKIISE